MDADQQPTRILAIRHGETAWNIEGRIQGQLDVPLNDTGRWQVHRLALAVADEDISAIYSTDLLRALETAQAVARGCDQPIATAGGLPQRGLGVVDDPIYDESSQRWPEQAERCGKRDPDFGVDGCETRRQCFERGVGAVARLAALHPGETIARVSQGGVMDCLYRAASGIALDAP